MQDLRSLAAFFVPHVDRILGELRRRHSGLFGEGDALLRSIRAGLLQAYFDLTHRTLVGHHKLIEDRVSLSVYADALREPALRDDLRLRYPVLARWMDSLEGSALRQLDFILTRFEADRPALQAALFAGAPLSRLTALTTGLGDAHRGGRSVALLELEDGSKLIYKPRSLDLDAHFAEVVDWVDRSGGPTLRVPKQVRGDGYGWAEFIAHSECADEAELRDYYRRFGALLCLLHVFGGHDFHFENIVACGGCPVPVDLESLFRPTLEAHAAVDSTVLNTGLLQARIDRGLSPGPDVSGGADAEGQEALTARLSLEPDGDGGLRFRRVRGTLSGARNVPILHGQKAPLTPERGGWVQEGFAELHRLLRARRDEVLALLPLFQDDEARVLFRHTAAYSHLLDEALHPALLLSEERMARHFGLLAGPSQAIKIGDLTGQEIAGLQRRDVPLFTVRVGGRHLIGDDGRSVPDVYALSGFETAARKIARLDEADLSKQVWTIGQVLRMADAADSSRPRLSSGPEARPAALRDRLLIQAERIADHIVGQVHEDDVHASWLVYRAEDEGNRRVEIAGAVHDLFSGMPGEILFLDAVGRALERPDLRATAAKALRFLADRLTPASPSMELGLFAGLGGVIYLLTCLGKTGGSEHRDSLDALLEGADLPAQIAADRTFSLLRGSAGLMLACAEAYAAFGSPKALRLAEACAEHLLAHRQPDVPGAAWRIVSASPLSGLSHGASGFAAAFARLHRVSADPRHREACLQILEYERTLHVPEEGNWRDLRDYTVRTGGPACALSWAHGAPGIGLARLCLLEAGIDGPHIRAELETAVLTTLREGLNGLPSLVSGDFGLLELPLRYAEIVDRRHWEPTRALIEQALDGLERRTAALHERGAAALGFMTGVTGIGYQCLRIARNDLAPSALSLDSCVRPSPLPLDGSSA